MVLEKDLLDTEIDLSIPDEIERQTESVDLAQSDRVIEAGY